MQLTQGMLEQLLDHHPVATLATLGENQIIHQVPIVFVRHDDVFWSPIDGKPKSGGELARLRNIQRNPNVSLLLDSYQQDWSRLWWIRIEGIARVLQLNPDNKGQIAPVIEALRSKHPQYQEIPVLTDTATLIKIKPNRVVSWCADINAVVVPDKE